MDLRQMEYLVALADEQHFTRAAAIAGVSQSGLSAAIRSLEDELDAPLFLRTTRRVEPTDACRALLPHARAMLAEAVAGRDAVVRATSELSGRLRVGAEQCLGLVDVPSLLSRLQRRYPQVDIDFTQGGSHALAAQVRTGDLDVAFVATGDHLGAASRTVLGRRPVVLVCPPEHPLATAGRLDWTELADTDFVDFHASWGVRSLNDAAFEARGVHRRVRCTVDDIHTLLELVDRGMGVALVPEHIAAKPQAARLVTVRMLPESEPQWVVSAVHTSPASPAALALLELLDAADAPREPVPA
ncbi:LysR family transcriptional regulator [Cellulomonas persica]|uniref:Transcriptional regulator n=1 Tax=Cellulomonas persica TaxID=76861 RepID=A0A510UX63_9CELL|nr:LysR family transcriptional regulator [Cellulomonas persica]GEK19248.1 transcriptional regulator [Cellulomonas persica]